MSEVEKIKRVAEALVRAESVFAITGAGVSAESGIPTFRGSDGLWRNFSAFDLATPEAFNRDPVTVWEWYLWRRDLIFKAEPNPAHMVLAGWEKRFSKFLIATQNVDRLHHQAGSHKVEEIHGNIWETRCTKTGRVFSAEKMPIDPASLPPVSPTGDLLRPNVVWFGEMLPTGPLQRIDEFLTSNAPDVTFVVGTTGVFGYVQAFAQAGSMMVEVNPEATVLSGMATISLRGPAGEILPKIDESISNF